VSRAIDEDREKARWDKFVAEHPDSGLDTELDDIWLNALAAWPEDPRPLARLLRSTPMTMGAQDLLANLIDPLDGLPSDPFILKAKRNPKWDRMLEELNAVGLYGARLKAGFKSEVAAKYAVKEAGKNVTARQIPWYRARLKRLARYLRGLPD
jgi:hypothetical protein